MHINIIFLIILSTLSPFCKKFAMGTMSNSQILLFQSIFLLPFNLWRSFSNDSKNIFDVSFNPWFYISIIMTFAGSVIYMKLCEELNPSDFIPIIQPSVIVATVFLDKLLGKGITVNKFMGCLFILLGLIILYMPDRVVKSKIKTNIQV